MGHLFRISVLALMGAMLSACAARAPVVEGRATWARGPVLIYGVYSYLKLPVGQEGDSYTTVLKDSPFLSYSLGFRVVNKACVIHKGELRVKVEVFNTSDRVLEFVEDIGDFDRFEGRFGDKGVGWPLNHSFRVTERELRVSVSVLKNQVANFQDCGLFFTLGQFGRGDK